MSPAGTTTGYPSGALIVSPPTKGANAVAPDCSVDVTTSLRNWLYSLPPGSPGHSVVVRFAKGACYQVDGSIFLRNFRNFVFDGNGAVFHQLTLASSGVIAEDRTVTPYCGNSYVPNRGRNFYTSPTPIMWWFDGGCDLVVENMYLSGGYLPGTVGHEHEMDSLIQMNGVQRALITQNVIVNAYGDFITLSGLHEAPGGGGTYPATDVTVTANVMMHSGRQGVTSEYVDRVSIRRNAMSGWKATGFDEESDVAGGCTCNLSIADNTIVGSGPFLVAVLSGATLTNFAFVRNHLVDGGQVRMAFSVTGSNVTIDGNVADKWTTWPLAAAIVFDATKPDQRGRVDKVEIAYNVAPTAPWGHATVKGNPFVTISPYYVTHVAVRGNFLPLTYGWAVPHTYSTVLPLYTFTGSPTVTGVGNQSCGNVTSNGTTWGAAPCPGPYSPPAQPVPPGSPNL